MEFRKFLHSNEEFEHWLNIQNVYLWDVFTDILLGWEFVQSFIKWFPHNAEWWMFEGGSGQGLHSSYYSHVNVFQYPNQILHRMCKCCQNMSDLQVEPGSQLRRLSSHQAHKLWWNGLYDWFQSVPLWKKQFSYKWQNI